MDEAVEFLEFADWVTFVFERDAVGPEWYFDPDAPYWAAPPTLTAHYLTRLFRDSAALLAPYSDAQVGRGLWYLFSGSCSDHLRCLTAPDVETSVRIACLDALTALYEQVFRQRCAAVLSHLDQSGANPINGACYMLWDVLPFFAKPELAERAAVDAAALRAMERALQIEALACQESALHGLGHWARAYPQRVQAIIAAFLVRSTAAGSPAPDPRLLRYAQAAAAGRVQ